MKDHHRDALVVGLIGLACGYAAGTVFTSYLYFPIRNVSALKESANWFAGIGTWIVGISATVLTGLQIRSNKQKEQFDRDVLELERQANSDRLAAEAADRRDREKRDNLVEVIQYKVATARYGLPREYVTGDIGAISDLRPQEASAMVRMMLGAIPSSFPPVPRALITSVDPAVFNMVEIAAALCVSYCTSYLENEPGTVQVMTDAITRLALRERLQNIAIVAVQLGERSKELQTAIDSVLQIEPP